VLEIFKIIEQSKKSNSVDRADGGLNDKIVGTDLEHFFRTWWSYLDEQRSRERNVTGPLHLVSLDRPIHALARRAVIFNNPTLVDQTEVSSYSIVSHYHDALLLLCERVYTAIQAGKITPRDDLLGARITFTQAPEFKSWRRLCRAVQRGDKAVVTEMLNAPIAVLTDSIFTAVLVDAVEFSTWAEAEGIATAGEIERLLGSEGSWHAGSQQNPTDINEQSSAIPKTEDEVWKAKAKQYADEIYRRDKASGCEPSKSDIAADVAKRFEKEGINGKRGRLDAQTILRHALSGWQKPA
jgi:hypothetical protein